MRDPFSIAGKFKPPSQHFDVVVVGAGSAGAAAATRAAKNGDRVLLVDENPLSPGLIGLDVPLFFGGRATAAVQNKGRMLEQVIAANPLIEAAFEAGVEVMLGTTVWGAFVNGPGLAALPTPMVGLADDERSWLCGFDRLVVASGARDLVLSFKGWDQPGVMGANAMHALLTRYHAFAGRSIVILGSGALALSTALLAIERGLRVAAIVEVRDRLQGPAHLVERVLAEGVPAYTSHVVAETHGGLDGVERILLAPTNDPDAPRVEIACDTICQAIGLVSAIELLAVLGAALMYDPARGGHVPVIAGSGQTSLPGVSAFGDCAGVAADDPDYGLDWMRALIAASGPDVIVCQCESVSRAALLGVKHPAYLGAVSKGMARRDIASLREDGPINQDQVKRLTRTGMGPCQGRRCREQAAMMLALSTGDRLADIPLASYRAPVRPLPLGVLANADEAPEMEAGWDVWFGIPTQWIPYAEIDTDREALQLAALSVGEQV